MVKLCKEQKLMEKMTWILRTETRKNNFQRQIIMMMYEYFAKKSKFIWRHFEVLIKIVMPNNLM